MATLLDPETVEVLGSMDAFFFQQRIRMKEAITQGCWEQENYYDVFDRETNKRIMIVKEESHDCSRCCCKPHHSVFLRFYHVGKDAPELVPGQKVDWSYEPSSPPFMTMEREGCDCGGPCPKPCLFCFACTEGCSEHATIHAGDLVGEPGATKGSRDRAKLLGESLQPIGGGGCRPVMQTMERDDADDAKGDSKIFAAAQGPAFFGGCIKLCCNADFDYGPADPAKGYKSVNFDDEYAMITKIKPNSLGQGAREIFTDSDIFDVKFTGKNITPLQKANVLAQLVHLDYMFFELDNDVCDGKSITICNCFCYGCVCPLKITKSDGGG
jgi:hypothetical protein